MEIPMHNTLVSAMKLGTLLGSFSLKKHFSRKPFMHLLGKMQFFLSYSGVEYLRQIHDFRPIF
jgi:hypothetical protein